LLVLYAPLNTAVINDLFKFLEDSDDNLEYLTKDFTKEFCVGICLDVLKVSCFLFLFFLSPLLPYRNF